MNLLDLWHLPYVRWHLIFTILPTVLLWTLFGKYLWRYKKTFLRVTLLSIVWGFSFDIMAAPILKIYFFDPPYLFDKLYFSLPLEEYFFLLIVPQEMTAIILLLRRRIYG